MDIVEERLEIELKTDTPGVIGAAIVKGKAAEIIDVSHYLGHGLGHRLDPKQSTGSREIRLLLVDDSQFFRNMLAPLLKASGYDVTLAASADEALALKDSGASFDLIVSDLDMPGMDGIALAERIKADPKWAENSADRAVLAYQPASDREEPGSGIRQLCRQVRPADADGHASGLLQAVGSGGMRAEDERVRAGDRRLRHGGDRRPAVRIEA